MKRLFCCALLLCLGLAGCGLLPPREAPIESPSLPAPLPPDPAEEWDVPGQPLSKPAVTMPLDIWETVPPPGPQADVELDPDTVTVDQSEIPNRLENAERWERFLEATKQGQPDGLTLRMVFDKGVYDLPLRFDGERYTLTDEGFVTSCRYLIVEEESDPPASARFSRAVHYLLSDDPEMTWERYFARMVSSALQPDEPAARSLFTVYE